MREKTEGISHEKLEKTKAPAVVESRAARRVQKLRKQFFGAWGVPNQQHSDIRKGYRCALLAETVERVERGRCGLRKT